MKKLLLSFGLLLLTTASFAQGGDFIPSGAVITVRTDEYINVKTADGRVYTGTVNDEIRDVNGNLAIPRGARVELLARRVSGRDIVLDLDAVTVEGRRYSVRADADEVSGNVNHDRDAVGGNQRTGKFVGGGAVLGTIIGAIAGGGKGAAIGAVAGAGAGAVAQLSTRGNHISVPSETLLTFRLDHRLNIGPADGGYDRNGHHYHR